MATARLFTGDCWLAIPMSLTPSGHTKPEFPTAQGTGLDGASDTADHIAHTTKTQSLSGELT